MKTFLTILWIITLVVVSFGNIVVVAPDFDKEAIGFSITPSEREEFRSLLEV